MSEIKFHKSLAKYYIKWFQDCHESAIYCAEHGNLEQAHKYLDNASRYLTIIMENWDAIEYFSVGDRAFLIDMAIPVEFRGYN